MDSSSPNAFGHPGITPRWTSSAKDGLGTAYHTSSRVWFTLSHGITNELYYPTVDQPNTRDIQLLITDGQTFCHEERRDLKHELQRPRDHTPHYIQINTDPEGRYRVTKDVICDPHLSVFLVRVRLEVLDAALQGRLKVYLLLAPHLRSRGIKNSASLSSMAGRCLLHAWKDGVHLVTGARPCFVQRSVGYVGASDGWQDLHSNYAMDWHFEKAEDGNVALTAELAFDADSQCVVGVGFGDSEASAACSLLQCLDESFDAKLEHYRLQWERIDGTSEEQDKAIRAWLDQNSSDKGRLYRISRDVLLSHEDKTYEGAIIASMSIPWGETKDDTSSAGYHLVWPRDLLNSSLALLASGHSDTPVRSLYYMSCLQRDDGDMPQNCWVSGQAFWAGEQLDEVAAPLLLAWHVRKHVSGIDENLWPMLVRGARRLMLSGPITGEDRWEENAGYSPLTLATIIGALTGFADLAAQRGEASASQAAYDYADWLASHIEDWVVTTRGRRHPEVKRHYIRLCPAEPGKVPERGAADTAEIEIRNGGGFYPARDIVDAGFLELVRLGIRPADDPIILGSLEVIDKELKVDLPGGPCWRRYNFDGYGQKPSGEAFDSKGYGGAWPLLTGERGIYRVAASQDAKGYSTAMEHFANRGGMLPEQLWLFDDIPERELFFGGPSGSAMPLCWAHAEYINLIRSQIDGVPFDRIDPAYERYVLHEKRDSAVEFWTARYPVRETPAGRTLRVIIDGPGAVRWSLDDWHTVQESSAVEKLPGLWSADLPGDGLTPGVLEMRLCGDDRIIRIHVSEAE